MGILTGGILSPIGLILSLVALKQPPRGFAIAGVVIGLIGSCAGFFVVLFVAGLIAAAAAAALAFATLSNVQQVNMLGEMGTTTKQVLEYKAENGVVPANLGLLGLSSDQQTDPWGNAYRYMLVDNELGFDLISDGADGQPNTGDDLSLSQFDYQVEELPDGGKRVSFNYQGFSVQAEGGDDGGVVEVRRGETVVLRMEGDDSGGRVNIGGTSIDAPQDGGVSVGGGSDEP